MRQFTWSWFPSFLGTCLSLAGTHLEIGMKKLITSAPGHVDNRYAMATNATCR
jgi:hypothetical protein